MSDLEWDCDEGEPDAHRFTRREEGLSMGGKVVKNVPSLKLFHVVTKDLTITFTTHDARKEFLKYWQVDELNRNAIICESDVTGEEYDRISQWRGRRE